MEIAFQDRHVDERTRDQLRPPTVSTPQVSPLTALILALLLSALFWWVIWVVASALISA